MTAPEERTLPVREGETKFLVQMTRLTSDGMHNLIWEIDEEKFDYLIEKMNELHQPDSEMFVPAGAMLQAHDAHINEAVIIENHNHPEPDRGTNEA